MTGFVAKDLPGSSGLRNVMPLDPCPMHTGIKGLWQLLNGAMGQLYKR